jgi:hypothetical protein
MGAKVAMTYGPIESASQQFQTTADVMKGVAAAAKAISDALKASFFGAIFGAEVIRRMDLISEKAKKMSKICEEFHNDLDTAEKDHKSGDYKEGTYFGKA